MPDSEVFSGSRKIASMERCSHSLPGVLRVRDEVFRHKICPIPVKDNVQMTNRKKRRFEITTYF